MGCWGEKDIAQDSEVRRQQFSRLMESRRAQEAAADHDAVRRNWIIGSEEFGQDVLRGDRGIHGKHGKSSARRSFARSCRRLPRRVSARRAMVAGGATCEDQDYLGWIHELQRQGFEIALHDAAASTSTGEVTCSAVQDFKRQFGNGQFLCCNHTGCRDGIYWGDARLSGWRRTVYNLATRGKRAGISRGHIESDPLFWGDVCRADVRYVRNFVFDDLDTPGVVPRHALP